MLKVILAVLIGILLRMLIGFSEYSGQSDPPVFGDFEAQRHWIEITTNLPVNMWYIDSQHNNLSYWPLDYPPLTAYHSMLCGKVANFLGFSKFFELYESKGIENETLKWFMRGTVLVSDVIIFFSAFVFYWNVSNPISDKSESNKYLLVTLISAPYIFVDHSHFQYNCVAIGLVVWSVNFLYCGYHALSIFSIVSAVFFKQTMLYFIPAFAFIYISIIINTKGFVMKVKKVIYFGLSGIFVTLSILFPFILDNIKNPGNYKDFYYTTGFVGLLTKYKINFLIPIIKRVIPIWRGAWENHVASFWFANIFIINLKKWAMKSEDNLNTALQICTTSTLLGFLPACLNLLNNPSRKKFEIALLASSLSFFLFSWQVHEKSIILPLTPALLLMDVFPWISLNLIIVSSFSLVTLSILDKTTSYLIVFGLFSIIISFNVLYDKIEITGGITGLLYNNAPAFLLILFSFMLICQYLIPPPIRYPWFHEFLNALVCAWTLFSLLIICTLKGMLSGKKNVQKKGFQNKDINLIYNDKN
ncbi:ALG6-like dolichyl pyrophosphate Man9 c2 alpha-1 [Cryptosporidium sp. chipmunk genotype I]|uniref:ALG6-like dolichyl pyrophosphate Man9 c2 alpha-1 n=1 Tax=Cryptosporidium sp. chipmunk genotype I TaxID=1280935 RepID=UPI00351AAAFF|nr:ALG6-like dolichyl pyrophosphate Man9 c2 alpha-1 [Cryptosporidium sp. chipmunk genotype I]